MDIFFTSLKTKKRVHVQWTLIHEPENERAKPLGDIESFTNVSISSQPIQLVIQRTVPRIILTTSIIKQNSSTNHIPFSRYKIGRINNKAKRPTMNRMVFSLSFFFPIIPLSYRAVQQKSHPRNLG